MVEDLISEMMKMGMKILLIIGAIFLVIYTIQAVILSETHKLKYGRYSFMAWIPMLNFYILGKVVFNRFFGLLVFIYTLIPGTFYVYKNGEEVSFNILPSNITNAISSSLPYVLGILYILAIIKYRILLKNGGKKNDDAIVLSKKTLKIPTNNNSDANL